MNYAVVSFFGKQLLVSEGNVVAVDKINGKVGDKLTFDQTLLLKDNEKITIGTPYVDNIIVEGEIVKQYKGEKKEIRKFKSKVRYRKKIGFRPQLTDIRITKIGTAESPAITKPKAKRKAVKKS